ncbi:GAGA-binding protein [Musa troglodytarum]|uniref:GAGA-binding protein n=1 Tax=Musa troglodytarum TaxID=320322 RepID=A0A9E7G643_9LILI|nr:GAGA-binding protein [Musa troglodytarum]
MELGLGLAQTTARTCAFHHAGFSETSDLPVIDKGGNHRQIPSPSPFSHRCLRSSLPWNPTLHPVQRPPPNALRLLQSPDGWRHRVPCFGQKKAPGLIGFRMEAMQ